MGADKVLVIYDDGDDTISEGKLTAPVVIICIAVASAGFMFGYNMGVFGGITTMEPFLRAFFPKVLDKMMRPKQKQDQFCSYTSSALASYTSSLYAAGMISALIAGLLTSSAGRKGALIIGGMLYLIGTCLQTLAVNLHILILGRSIAGFGIGFTNQAAPIYLCEMAPARWRGAIGTGFQFFGTLGVYMANLVNFFLMPHTDKSWRIAIALSGFPATIMTVIAFFIPDTPSSLIQRGKLQEALRSLNQARTTGTNTENELRHLIKCYEAVRAASKKSYQILWERRYRAYLVMAIAIPSFHQLTGINLYGGLGFIIFPSLRTSFLLTYLISFIVSTAILLSLFVATILIDRIGRRILLLQGGFQIFICHVVFAILMVNERDSAQYLSKGAAIVGLLLTGLVGAAFAWSWGTMLWILPTEILPLEVRSSGLGLCIAFNFMFQIIATETSGPMLCHFKFGVFLYYAVWVIIMTIFVVLFLPETKRIPLELMDKIWRTHWYWHRFVDETRLESQMNQ